MPTLPWLPRLPRLPPQKEPLEETHTVSHSVVLSVGGERPASSSPGPRALGSQAWEHLNASLALGRDIERVKPMS